MKEFFEEYGAIIVIAIIGFIIINGLWVVLESVSAIELGSM